MVIDEGKHNRNLVAAGWVSHLRRVGWVFQQGLFTHLPG
jgi:hypothetical protein